MGGSRPREYIEAKLVTHRRDPLFQGTYEGRPPNESTTIRGVSGSMGLKEFLQRAGVPGVVDACVTEGGCGTFHAVVSIRKHYPGQPRDIFSLQRDAGFRDLHDRIWAVLEDEMRA